MFTADMTHTKTLEQFSKDLTEGQNGYHGHNYCEVHDAIRRLLKDCDTYKELGVKQGTTLAIALMEKPKSVIGIDKTLKDYKPNQHLFEKYAKEHGVIFRAFELDSLHFASAYEVDLLYIDTWHVYQQLVAELKLHSPFVNKYIVMHDTNAKPELRKVIKEFLANSKNQHWKMIEQNTNNVGYTVLENTKK